MDALIESLPLVLSISRNYPPLFFSLHAKDELKRILDEGNYIELRIADAKSKQSIRSHELN